MMKRKLAKGETVFGAWISAGSPTVLDVLRNFSFDWFLFDMEHTPISIETVGRMMQVLNGSTAAPLVRIGQIDQAAFKSVLDAGAQGVIVPLVNTPEEAERAVRFCKYPPRGVRGVAGSKAADYGLTLAKYIRTANDETSVIVQIETPQAIENIDKIVAVEGVDIAFVGPSDLTMTLGLLDDRNNPKVVEAMLKVVKACNAAGKVPGVMAVTPDEAKLAVQRGFRFITIGTDVKFLTLGAKAFLESVGRS
jgi:2-keto-3-deoxy-L-rhamnonate aldolase RhmA